MSIPSSLFFSLLSAGVVFLSSGTIPAEGADDIVIGDFSGPDFGTWQVTGPAFGGGPVSGDELAKLGIDNSRNFGVVTSMRSTRGTAASSVTSPSFKIERPSISFLISGSQAQHFLCLNLLIDGKVVKSATGGMVIVGDVHRLEADSWDVSSLAGKDAQIQILDAANGGPGAISVAHVIQTDHPEYMPPYKAPLYQESLRPQFHFTGRQFTVDKVNPQQGEEGWINDVNGPIYYDGEYHLFAQRWARCWIHAVSRDLVHWTELEPAFWETARGSGVQSGTCVIDYNNTSGLSPNKAKPAMIAIWPTWDNKTQNLSYSLDHGKTWTAYDKNPVLVAPERDPKIFWYEPTKTWVMVLCDHDVYRIYTSKNMLSW